MKTEMLATQTPALLETAVARAVALLRAGELVGLPTETVYGLAANALNAEAVARIFAVKGRPSHNPIIVHVASLEMARRCVAAWPTLAQKLADAFWPGPLTLVLPRAEGIPAIVTAGGPTIGVRWPSHPVIQAVIGQCGFPLAAPSANLANRISPTTAEHVRQGLAGKIRLILDGGHSQIGIESTVLDLTVQPPRVLRPGMIHEASLRAVTGGLASGRGDANHEVAALRSPGMLKKHYSPQATLAIRSWRDDADLKFQISNLKFSKQRTHVLTHTQIPSRAGWGQVSVMPRQPAAFARALYAELHAGDQAGAELIVVEAVPPGGEWRGIADRLQRAAA